MEPIISVKGLNKQFKTYEKGETLWDSVKSLFKRKYVYKQALDNVSFEIKEGEIVGLIGPNGAGKSTLIKAMCGVLLQDSGEVRCLGYDPWKERTKYVQNIGAVFGQKTQLWWDLPATDAYDMFKSVYQIPQLRYERRKNYMIKLLKVEGIANTPVRKMSLGERMKCEAIAALLHDPKIVFLDEPTIGMDVIAKQKLRDFIKRTNKIRKTTFILTTHNMDDIEDLCERVIVINFGKIVYDGHFEDIKRKYVTYKRINVKFEEPPKHFRKPANSDIIFKEGVSLILDIDITKKKLSGVIDYLINKFKVDDITISDPPVDKIIKAIYKEMK